jgi:threonylcarbamoyladenosine tRNA methylthiotransferase MtaB
MTSVYVKTMGCKVNTYDSHALENQFEASGYQLADTAEKASITVVNTCSVTANADREARYLARKIRRENPDTVLVFTGCYAQTDSAKLVEMDEVDFVVPNEAKEELVDLIMAGAHEKAKLPESIKAVKENRQTHFKSALTLFDKASSKRTRAFLKIQDGCNNFCAYCLIPYARGVSRSVNPDEIIQEVNRLAETGTKEVVLTGIHIGDYGRDLDYYKDHQSKDDPIVDLMERFFAIPNIRVRISSLEPSEASEALLDVLFANKERVCDHFHLPLQSGSDHILKLMGREYDKAEYSDAVHRIRLRFPEAHIGADIIPGFPGETDEHAKETIVFIESLALSSLHVFPYSKRPNTRALRMPDHVDGNIIKSRASSLRNLSDDLHKKYMRKFIGKNLTVIWEKDFDKSNRRMGRTSNYLPVVAPDTKDPGAGSLTIATLKGLVDNVKILAVPAF